MGVCKGALHGLGREQHARGLCKECVHWGVQGAECKVVFCGVHWEC